MTKKRRHDISDLDGINDGPMTALENMKIIRDMFKKRRKPPESMDYNEFDALEDIKFLLKAFEVMREIAILENAQHTKDWEGTNGYLDEIFEKRIADSFDEKTKSL